MLVCELETPAVVVDLNVMERNLSRMAEYCRSKNIKLRPHTKSHKIPELARLQLASGATGITVAKLGEAEVMIKAGITDILVAYPVVGREKASRLSVLAEQANICVSLDSEEAARAISAEATTRHARVGILVELDVGFRRCGIANENDLSILAQKISSLPGLEFKGLMFFPGQFVVGPQERATLLGQVNTLLARTLEKLEREGLAISIVSGGSTPTAYDSHLFRGVNEVRPGMYIFYDRNMVGIGVAGIEDCALSIVVTVVSNSVADRAIIDGGSKTFSSDRYLAGDGKGFGIIKEDSSAVLESLSEEHGHLDIKQSTHRYKVPNRNQCQGSCRNPWFH
ncbi:MAG TPA: alanine racemase [Pyrinomonadaceae bacterium]|nr:alanine racemase [Pyrinomonadaceae bacterium]